MIGEGTGDIGVEARGGQAGDAELRVIGSDRDADPTRLPDLTQEVCLLVGRSVNEAPCNGRSRDCTGRDEGSDEEET
jgi:hypothetical protein